MQLLWLPQTSLAKFFGVGHLPLHVSSNGRWRIKDYASAPRLGCFLESFCTSLGVFHIIIMEIMLPAHNNKTLLTLVW